MKIRLSIRLYLLATLLFLVTSLAALYAVVTIHYLEMGLDFSSRHTMRAVANAVELDHNGRGQLLDYQVARRFADVPDEIRKHFREDQLENLALQKYLQQDNLFLPPQRGYFLMLVREGNGEPRYISRTFEHPEQTPDTLWSSRYSPFHNPLTRTLLLGLTVVAAFALLLLLIMRSVSNPVEALRDWARALNSERLQQPPPHFRYHELNNLADIIRNSLLSVKQALDREQDFLSHASHELRTPIATVRSNVELLRKLNTDGDARTGKIIDRLERASATMIHLTETLLWLSRETDSSLPMEDIRLDQLVKQIAQDLNYLLQGKLVTVHLQTEQAVLSLPRVAVQIMLANLIRNAFQHTQAGEVWIQQQAEEVSIVNHNQATSLDDNNALGFGLGLDLTRKLASRFGWHYRNEANEQGHAASVNFAVTPTTHN